MILISPASRILHLPYFSLYGVCVCVCVCVQGGVVYYKSSALTGTKKDPKSIGKQAAGPFECGCRSAKKKVESASRERALKQGEIVW